MFISVASALRFGGLDRNSFFYSHLAPWSVCLSVCPSVRQSVEQACPIGARRLPVGVPFHGLDVLVRPVRLAISNI